MKKTCRECGLEFETKTSATLCNRDHYRTCVICGKQFLVPRRTLNGSKDDIPQTCSKECRAEKRKQTNIAKYGGEAPASSKEIRQKIVATNLAKYGTEHPTQSEQVKQKTKATCLERYGVASYFETDEIKQLRHTRFDDEATKQKILAKYKATCLERYGVEHVSAVPEVREKFKSTMKERYGVEYTGQSKGLREKVLATTREHYGVDFPFQNEEVMNRIKQTNQLNYGVDNPMQRPEVLQKVQKTCLERYGDTCYLQSEEGKAKTKQRLQEKYGVDYFSKSSVWKVSRVSDPNQIQYLMEFDSDPVAFISKYYPDGKPTYADLLKQLGVRWDGITDRLKAIDSLDLIQPIFSTMEKEVIEFISNLDNNIRIEKNTKAVITPYELDLYLPDYKFAIECNPTATHNANNNVFNQEPHTSSYHKMKTDLCEQQGIFLFHIFGYEWEHKSEIIKSMIANILGYNQMKIYARKCDIREVSSEDAWAFLNTNHRQGATRSSVNLGLYYQDELVSLMTFGKMRSTIGTSKAIDNSNNYELVRFCSKLNTSVIGGASKLFKYFCKNYAFDNIISFSDRAHTKGNLYETLGFTQVSTSHHGYVWVDGKDNAYHRVNAQKHNLKRFLGDDTIDLSKTERQIMVEHGFVQVYDSGVITWKYTRA